MQWALSTHLEVLDDPSVIIHVADDNHGTYTYHITSQDGTHTTIYSTSQHSAWSITVHASVEWDDLWDWTMTMP